MYIEYKKFIFVLYNHFFTQKQLIQNMDIDITQSQIVFSAIIPFTIAIFTFVFPLLFQITTRIEEKYNGSSINGILKKEEAYKNLLINLIISFILLLFWILQYLTSVDIGILKNISFTLNSISTIALLINTIILIKLIHTYYTAIQLIERLNKKYNKLKTKKNNKLLYIKSTLIGSIFSTISFIAIINIQFPRKFNFGILNLFIENSATFFYLSSICLLLVYIYKYINFTSYKDGKLYLLNQEKTEKDKEEYFNSISQIFFYSLHTANEKLARKADDIVTSIILKYQKNLKTKVLDYPSEFYSTIFESIVILQNRERKTISYYDNSALYTIFIDHKHIISERTYTYIWKCLLQDMLYLNTSSIMDYWIYAHQHYNYYLQKINEIRTKNKLTNSAQINERDKERERFTEFHYALGGLFMYKKKYELIQKTTSYSHSIPKKYVLVPQTLAEVIFQYMNTAPELFDAAYYQRRYPFPDIVGADTDYAIQKWIKDYLAILFLRQYTISQHEIYSDPLRMPQIPEEKAEKQAWNNQLDYLLESVNKYLKDTKLLKAVGLEQLTNENFFKENKKETPEILIKRYKAEIKKSLEETERNQDLDPSKVEAFKHKAREILGKSIEEHKKNWLKGNIEKDYLNIGIKGKVQIMEKNAFAKEQVSTYLNADSFLAESIKREFQYFAPNIMYRMQKTDFLLKEEDILKAINSLKLDTEKFVILSFGNDLNYYQSELQISNLEETQREDERKWTYENIDIIDIDCSGSELFFNSFVIIKKEDLPQLIPHDISKENKNKYLLRKPIDAENYIYASIIDLNKNKVLKEEIEKQQGATDLSKSVLACIMMNLEIRCKKTAKCIQLNIFSQFKNQGTPNKLSDVKSIW